MLGKVTQLNWSKTYDVIVLGFGGAGATAARFAADAGAKVLIVDAAPSGHEGGNTRYSAQAIATVTDFDQGKAYYDQLTQPLHLDETTIDTFVTGMLNIPEYVRTYLGVSPISVQRDLLKGDMKHPLAAAVHEYPEFEGQEASDATLVHPALSDAGLWQLLRQQIVDRTSQIDVWFESPAEHLIQEPDSGAIIGVAIKRHGQTQLIRAVNGVVLSVGGYENDPQALEDYLGTSHLAPLGTLYNRGDGLLMAEEVGADLWHMANYESAGMLHGLTGWVAAGERGQFIPSWSDSAHGSVMTVADDGTRYFREDEPNRHGHLADHGTWRIPRSNVHPYLIFDQVQLDQMKANGSIPVAGFDAHLIKAATLAELAHLIQVKPEVLQHTVATFNQFAQQGNDLMFNRSPESMRALVDGAYYALRLVPVVLNTQGGPRRNAASEILSTNQKPIPHLYGAGELGGICTNLYQGGSNLAECLIFGKIAGENAAKPKADAIPTDETKTVTDTMSKASTHVEHDSDLSAFDPSQVVLAPNQYLGIDNDGIGGLIAVRVTYDQNQLKNVEIINQSETGEVGGRAVAELPKRMVAANSYEVDSVTGASVSSRAIKNAVKDALQNIK